MSNLLIIGNGFDLHHGLKTDFHTTFQNIVRNRHPETFNLVNQMFSADDGELWQDFEGSIGSCTDTFIQEFIERHNRIVETFYSTYSEPTEVFKFDEDDDLWGDVFLEVKMAAQSVETNAPTLQSLTKSYQSLESTAEDLSNSLKIMAANANKQLGSMSPHSFHNRIAAVITFNYTETIEKLYAIPENQIIHIHGTVENPIWGNASARLTTVDQLQINTENTYLNDDLFSFKHDGKAYTYPETAQDFWSALSLDNTIQEFLEWVHQYIEDFEKPLGLSRLKSFLTHVNNATVDHIFVLGHSLGDVDIPYFESVASTFPRADWTVSYYIDNEKVALSERCRRFLPSDTYEDLKLDTLDKILSYL